MSAPKGKQRLAKNSAKVLDDKKNNKLNAHNPSTYHPNANRHGIHALRQFNCPVCLCINTVRVDLNRKMKKATVKCSYCMGLTEAERKGSPYPYETSYVPRLETVADCFFRFQHVYEDLTKKAQAEHGEEEIIVEKEVPPVSGPTGGGLFGEDFFSSLGETVQAEKPTLKRRREGSLDYESVHEEEEENETTNNENNNNKEKEEDGNAETSKKDDEEEVEDAIDFFNAD